ncbi:MAG: SPFH domain-containing protein [Sphingobacterium sp.]
MRPATSKLPFIEILEWVEHSPNLMMWKVPDGDKEIKNGAHLIVRESQKAMFMNQGNIADVFDSGTHTLTTQNIPILSRLNGWKYGFQSPFKADVYFFSVKQFVNLKWGTPAPIIVTDAKFGQVRLRAFGSYNVRIVDIPRFFKEYAGSYPELSILDFQQQLRDYIAPKFAEALTLAEIPLLEVARNHTELNARIEPLIAPYFEDFGIAITQFTVTSVTLPDEVTRYFDQVTGMNIVGEAIDRFQQFNTAVAIGKDNHAAQQGAQQGIAMGIMMKEMNTTNAPPIASAVAPEKTITEDELETKLKQIKSLFDRDLIDEQEYKEKKSELLSKL